MHVPTVLSLAIGTGVTLLDLHLWLRRTTWELLEDLATHRVGERRLVDLLERAGLVEVSRDPFGDILKLAWRVDASTALTNAVRITIKHLPAPPGRPLSDINFEVQH